MWMWAVPAAIVIATAAPAFVLISRLAEEARRLAAELRAMGELRPAMVELRGDVRRAQLTAARLRDRA